jgi:DNA polymerase-1
MQTQPTRQDAYKLFHEGILAFSRAEEQGLRIDLDYCRETENAITEEIHTLQSNFFATQFYEKWNRATKGKPNIDSNSQLGYYLYQVKGLKPAKKTASGQGSTDQEALDALDIPEIKDLLRIRKLKKTRDTYLKGFQKEQINGYVHPNFNLHIARTYRSSSSNPNFQNIPKRDKETAEICRKAFFARPGNHLVEVDYSSIEVCISACYHHDPQMIKYIENPSSDMHGDMAEQIFFLDKLDKSIPGHKTLRSASKNGFVFPQFYGDYYGNSAPALACQWGNLPEKGRWKPGTGIEIEKGRHLSDQLLANGQTSLKKFTEHIRQIEEHFWNTRFKVYNQWKEDWWAKYQSAGTIEMYTGFQCKGIMSRNDATNYPIQGTAFHCLLWSFIQLDKFLRKKGYETRLVGQIHDAIVLDVPPAELKTVAKLLRFIMVKKLREHWDWIIVPLDIEIDVSEAGGSWNEMTPYNA